MTILDEIAAKTRERVVRQKQRMPLAEVRRLAEEKRSAEVRRLAEVGKYEDFPFERALRADGISFICEVKKASPSKGVIAQEFPYLEIAKEYEAAGASAISCLTEPYYFQGSDRYLQEIAEAVKIPVLRKDFTVDEYMIYEAKMLGASAVLLICSILSEAKLLAYRELADSLGLSALVEAHSDAQICMALRCGAKILGVNNRNLKDFSVDIGNSARLRAMVPEDVIYVSESGVQSAEDIRILRENGTDAVLIGELLMRAKDKRAMLAALRGDADNTEGKA